MFLEVKVLSRTTLIQNLFVKVSQKWKFFIDEVKIKELVISNKPSSWSSRETWYRTKAKINSRNRITFSKIERCPFVLTDLKRLRLEGTIYSYRFNLNELLALFPNLCHLEIFWFQGNNTGINLNLPATLKTISFDVVDKMKLYLHSPQLQNVFCGSDIRNIKFSHPESIKHLKIDNLENEHNKYDDLQVFPNVECFHCGDYSYTLDGADLELIRLFPKAKVIRFELGAMEVDEDFDKLENVINDVIEQKNILGRTDLNIFCDRAKMVDRSSFRSYAYSW